MITGAHSIIYSTDPEADGAFLKDVIGFPHVDAGGGWLIFGLPPSEVAVHPSEKNNIHEFYLMCDDIEGFAIWYLNHEPREVDMRAAFGFKADYNGVGLYMFKHRGKWRMMSIYN